MTDGTDTTLAMHMLKVRYQIVLITNLGAAMSLLHQKDGYQRRNEASDGRNVHAASNESSQLIVLPFLCPGLSVVGELENTNTSVDCEQFWQGYRVMSGIIFVLLAMEMLIFGFLWS